MDLQACWLLHPQLGVKSIVISVSVCLSVSSSVRAHNQKPFKNVQISAIFLHLLPVPWSSSDGSAICHVLPVIANDVMFTHNGANGPKSKAKHMFARWRHQSDVRQRCLVEFARWRHWGRSLPSPTASRLELLHGGLGSFVPCSSSYKLDSTFYRSADGFKALKRS